MRLESEQGTHSGKHVRIKADACELTCTNHHPSPGKTHCVPTTGFFLSPVCLRSVSVWALNFRGNISKKYNLGNYSDFHSLRKKNYVHVCLLRWKWVVTLFWGFLAQLLFWKKFFLLLTKKLFKQATSCSAINDHNLCKAWRFFVYSSNAQVILFD